MLHVILCEAHYDSKIRNCSSPAPPTAANTSSWDYVCDFPLKDNAKSKDFIGEKFNICPSANWILLEPFHTLSTSPIARTWHWSYIVELRSTWYFLYKGTVLRTDNWSLWKARPRLVIEREERQLGGLDRYTIDTAPSFRYQNLHICPETHNDSHQLASLLALVLHDVPAQEQHREREENPYQRWLCCHRQEHVVLALVGKLQSFPTSSWWAESWWSELIINVHAGTNAQSKNKNRSVWIQVRILQIEWLCHKMLNRLCNLDF